jgi:hypothetical protein
MTTKPQDRAKPNHFELQGDGAQISFAESGIDGKPVLSYQPAQGLPVSFRGEQIRVAEGELGRTVTVMLEQVPDLHTVTLTLLLPEVNLPQEGEAPVQTVGIVTTSRTSIGGPALVQGALQSHCALDLQGIARIVQS